MLGSERVQNCCTTGSLGGPICSVLGTGLGKFIIEKEVLGCVHITTLLFSTPHLFPMINVVEKIKLFFPVLEQQKQAPSSPAHLSFQAGRTFAYCHYFYKFIFLTHSSF